MRRRKNATITMQSIFTIIKGITEITIYKVYDGLHNTGEGGGCNETKMKKEKTTNQMNL